MPHQPKPAEQLAAELMQQAKPVPAERIEAIYDEEREHLNNELLREQVNKFKEDNEARRKFATALFVVTVIWMVFILIIVVAYGRGWLQYPSAVVITLITTTTANVFGFMYIVANYLFNKDKST
jgi:uncharacterized membrane protein (DUF485 family)